MPPDVVAIDAEFRAAGLEPVAPYTRAADERECRCVVCGTVRRVKLRTLRTKGGVACRWCHGWEKWGPWGAAGRRRARDYGWPLGGPIDVVRRLAAEDLAPLTPVGDLYDAVGALCLRCAETFVTMPARMDPRRPSWYGCARCSQDRKRQILAGAEELFHANGLRLVGSCRGEYVPQLAVCLTCGIERRVSYAKLRDGTTPLCWTCTHGIRPDEPHRVYLFRFPGLRVMKVGLTHDRHDRRLLDHTFQGGELVESIVVTNREAARRLESFIKAKYAPWVAEGIGPAEFPQGGWTEAWRDDAPPLHLQAAALVVQPLDEPA